MVTFGIYCSYALTWLVTPTNQQKACLMLPNSLENSMLKCIVKTLKSPLNAQILSRIQPKTATFRPTKA